MAEAELRRRLQALKQELGALTSEMVRLRRDERACRRNFDLVVSSAYCPTCLRPLSLEYKHEYSEKVAKILADIKRRLEEASGRQRLLEEEIRNIERALGAQG